MSITNSCSVSIQVNIHNYLSFHLSLCSFSVVQFPYRYIHCDIYPVVMNLWIILYFLFINTDNFSLFSYGTLSFFNMHLVQTLTYPTVPPGTCTYIDFDFNFLDILVAINLYPNVNLKLLTVLFIQFTVPRLFFIKQGILCSRLHYDCGTAYRLVIMK